MNIERTIREEISPFFKFANYSNPSNIVYTSKISDQQTRTHVIYQNCVCCNTRRFTSEELSCAFRGTDTYFCNPCFEKVAKVTKKYDTGTPSKESELFQKLWNHFLYHRMIRNRMH